MAKMEFTVKGPKRQRPPIAKDVQGHPVLGIRISEELRAKFAEQAASDGYNSVGTWLRSLGVRRCETAELDQGLGAED